MPPGERAEEDLSAAYVLASSIERIDPDAPKPLWMGYEVYPAINAVRDSITAGDVDSDGDGMIDDDGAVVRMLKGLGLKGTAFRPEDLREMSSRLNELAPLLRRVFEENLIEVDGRLKNVLSQ